MDKLTGYELVLLGNVLRDKIAERRNAVRGDRRMVQVIEDYVARLEAISGKLESAREDKLSG